MDPQPAPGRLLWWVCAPCSSGSGSGWAEPAWGGVGCSSRKQGGGYFARPRPSPGGWCLTPAWLPCGPGGRLLTQAHTPPVRAADHRIAGVPGALQTATGLCSPSSGMARTGPSSPATSTAMPPHRCAPTAWRRSLLPRSMGSTALTGTQAAVWAEPPPPPPQLGCCGSGASAPLGGGVVGACTTPCCVGRAPPPLLRGRGLARPPPRDLLCGQRNLGGRRPAPAGLVWAPAQLNRLQGCSSTAAPPAFIARTESSS